MKRRIFFAILLIAAAWGAGRLVQDRHVAASAVAGRDEIHETFTLEPGASVEVFGINGPVTVETADTSTAEVHVVRTANDASDLEHGKVKVESNSRGLVVRGGGNVRGFWRKLFGGGSVRHEVTLKLPRRVDFAARGVNGQVRVGEVDGSVVMSGVNGRVDLSRVGAHAQLSGVNGGVTIALPRLAQGGIEMNGINGGVEYRLAPDVNADVEINGLNGSVSMSLPNVTSEGRPRHHRSRYSARLGAGGPSIEMHGINGNVRFVSLANATATAG